MLTVNIKLNCTRNTIGSGTILSGEHGLYVLGELSIVQCELYSDYDHLVVMATKTRCVFDGYLFG